MGTKSRKIIEAVIAGVTAVALLVGGTYAWTSISQRALNESTGIVNVGGRLHDDYTRMTTDIAVLLDTGDSSIDYNKDVYVENFTDPLNGGQPIYARIRFDEYMEIGSEAGKIDENGNYDASRNAKSVVAGAKIDDPSGWSTHVPSTACERCENGETCLFHEHWVWTMGGQTTYMPTFNKDKDSLEADVNGTYQGVNIGDNIYFDDYIIYTTDTNGATFTEGTDTLPITGAVYQKTATAYYDDDTDGDPNIAEGQYRTATETHTAKETSGATVMMMNQWIAEGKKPGNYWVYDADGWAYWANPIMPGSATGLLLDGIDMIKNPGDKCYYAINVVAQFATVGDWEYFEDGGKPSLDAQELLEAASENIPTVSITPNENITLSRGESAEFTANVTLNDETSSNVSWRVVDTDGKPLNTATTIDENGKLTVGADETNSNLIVVAESKDYPGAVALKTVTVTVLQVLVTAADNATEIDTGETLQFSATVTLNGEKQEIPVIWTVSGATDSNTVIEPNTGLLTVGKNETANAVLTVTATTTAESGAFQGSVAVTVNDDPLIMRITGGSVVSPGDEVQLSAIITKKGVEQTNVPVTWSVSGDNGADISQSGLLKVDSTVSGGSVFVVNATVQDGPSVDYEVFVVEYSFDANRDLNFSPFCYWGITDSGNDTYTLWMFEVYNQGLLGDWSRDPNSITINGEKFITLETTGVAANSEWLHSDGPSHSETPWSTTTAASDPHHGLAERKVTKAVIMTELHPTATAWWFYDMQGLTAVYGMDNLDMSNCTDVSFMFGGGSWGDPMAFTSLDVSSWDVSKVEDFSWMFFGGENLVELTGIENWKTTSAKNMDLMFEYCGILEIDLSGWDVSSKPTHQSFAYTPNVVKNKITEPIWLD